MIDYKNVSNEELEKEIEKVRNTIYLYQDNHVDTSELMEYLSQLNNESLRRQFEEMPPEVLIEKLENMVNPENIEKMRKEFEEKYLQKLPDMPLARFEGLLQQLKIIREKAYMGNEIDLFFDFIDIAIEMREPLTDFYNLLLDKHADRFDMLTEKLFRPPVYQSITDAMDYCITSAEKALNEMQNNPYTQTAYETYNLFHWNATWMMSYVAE